MTRKYTDKQLIITLFYMLQVLHIYCIVTVKQPRETVFQIVENLQKIFSNVFIEKKKKTC